ncbi:MAG: hypothetical protein KAY24_20065 [Candidatus Eisenbacteria sp.]|nr:hypothetical protein [Candidatus Eisenbacteria bacterium]
MTLRYGDRFPDRGARLECFGRSAYYSSGDHDCQRCDFFEECGDAVNNRSRSIPVRNSGVSSGVRKRQPEGRGVEESDTPAGAIEEEESGFERFAKDCATGACRGAMWEGYQFFVRFRF